MQDLIQRIKSNDHLALSRTISKIENGESIPDSFFIDIHSATLKSIRIGITGPPGVGKSTISNGLIHEMLDDDLTVGVIAIDPTSPFTGGSVLGDRVRMNSHAWDNRVFIRSMGSRGDLGGLSKKAEDTGDIIGASGKDFILFETVGVGQGEIEIANTADITIVVLSPESGDEVQFMKAGLLEIADIYVINKSDRPGSNNLHTLLTSMVHLNLERDGEFPFIIKTEAHARVGLNKLFRAIKSYYANINKKGILRKKRINRYKYRVLNLIKDELLLDFWSRDKKQMLETLTDKIDTDIKSPHELAQLLLQK
jgi:LAO/AO transport system kinase